MELLARTDKHLKTVAALLGIVQGITWIVMTIICISLYIKDPTDPTSIDSYMEEVNNLIYSLFLRKDSRGFEDQTLTPQVFFGFMWGYLFLDLAWVLVSIFVLCNRNAKTTLKFWSLVTSIVCLLDFIVVIILGADYDKCINTGTSVDLQNEMACADAILPVLVIVAKGFVLWLINVIFIVIALILVKKLRQQPYIAQYNASPQFENSLASQALASPQPTILQYPISPVILHPSPTPSPQRTSSLYAKHYRYPQSPTVPRSSLPPSTSPSRRQPQYNYYPQSPIATGSLNGGYAPQHTSGRPGQASSLPSPSVGSRLHWSGFTKAAPPPPNPKPFVLRPPPKRF